MEDTAGRQPASKSIRPATVALVSLRNRRQVIFSFQSHLHQFNISWRRQYVKPGRPAIASFIISRQGVLCGSTMLLHLITFLPQIYLD